MTDDAFPIPLEEQLREVRREIAKRERLYPNLVSCGRMKANESEFHLRAMRAVAQTLRTLLDKP